MKEKKKEWKKNKDLLVSSRWRRAAECPPGSQAPGRPWQTLWERERDKESREFAMEWEIGRRMTAGTRGGQGEVQWGWGRWNGGALKVLWVLAERGGLVGWFGAAPAIESCLWVCHRLCAAHPKNHHQTLINSPQRRCDKPEDGTRGLPSPRNLKLDAHSHDAAAVPYQRRGHERKANDACEKQTGWGCVRSAGLVERFLRPLDLYVALEGNP